jgi:hypothetical protein
LYINIDPKESVNYELDLDGVQEVDGEYLTRSMGKTCRKNSVTTMESL